MRVPQFDLKQQYAAIAEELKQAVTEVLDSARYVLGPPVEQLERQIAEYAGVTHGVGVSSGTDALLVALMALNTGPGDLVVTTSFSFMATAGTIARLNATPVFIDIDPDTYNMDPKALQEWFAREPKKRAKVKAILPVHLYGQCADMTPILQVAEQQGIPVIEDAAQAIGALYPTDAGVCPSGSLGYAGCFSFYPTKNLGGIGDGGMVVTNDDAVADTLRTLRNHGESQRYYYETVGGNFRLDAIQAAALLVKLKYLDEWTAQRQRCAAYYDKGLHVDQIKKPVVAYESRCHVFNQYVVSVRERRDEFREYLAKHDIGSTIYYPTPLHLQPCFRMLGYYRGDLPNSEYAAEHVLALPMYPELTDALQDYVIETSTAFFQ